eukprot:5671460-Amphidinium_carterae.1
MRQSTAQSHLNPKICPRLVPDTPERPDELMSMFTPKKNIWGRTAKAPRFGKDGREKTTHR